MLTFIGDWCASNSSPPISTTSHLFDPPNQIRHLIITMTACKKFSPRWNFWGIYDLKLQNLSFPTVPKSQWVYFIPGWPYFCLIRLDYTSYWFISNRTTFPKWFLVLLSIRFVPLPVYQQHVFQPRPIRYERKKGKAATSAAKKKVVSVDDVRRLGYLRTPDNFSDAWLGVST